MFPTSEYVLSAEMSARRQQVLDEYAASGGRRSIPVKRRRRRTNLLAFRHAGAGRPAAAR